MFDKLFNAFAGVAKSLSEKELSEKDLDDILFDLELSLLESDVASEVVDMIKSDLKKDLIGTRVEKSTISDTVRSSLISSISSLFDEAGSVNVPELVRKKKEETGQPFLILFVGINGTGKTTSLAKVAYMLQQAKYSIVVAASDTFRAGAIEQLKEHTKRLNLKLVAQNYNSDPAAVARDAVLYAKSHRTDCVLIDTAGRMQTSKNLMEQIAKITNVVKPDLKIFVGDSLAGNDTVNQAREFFEHTRFDAAILTKVDADARGGAALSIAKVTSAPVIYVGVGQEYEDLKPFDKKIFLEIVFGKVDDDDLQAKKSVKSSQKEVSSKRDEEAVSVDDMSNDDSPKIKDEKVSVNDTDSASHVSPTSPPPTPKEPDTVAAPPSITAKQQPQTPAPKEPDTVVAPPSIKAQQQQQPPPSPSHTPKEPDTVAEPPSHKEQQSSPPPPQPQKEPDIPTPNIQPPTPDPKQSNDHTSDSHTAKASPQHDDPFYGIEDSDIAVYSDKFDVPPPENDDEASDLARKIRKWIQDKRPDPVDDDIDDTHNDDNNITESDTVVDDTPDTKPKSQDSTDTITHHNDDEKSDDTMQQNKNTDKPKKKRGMFGFLRRGSNGD